MTTFKRLRAFCRVLKGNKLWRQSAKSGWLRTQIEGADGKGDACFCPLTYAYYVQTGEIIPVCEFAYAAESLGFDKTEADQIAEAADEKAHSGNTKLRRILERACGVRKAP